MRVITIKLPVSVEIPEYELKLFFASKLYETGKLSLGQAAKVSGVTKRTFMELLDKFGVSLFNYPASDLEHDYQNAKSYVGKFQTIRRT